ncbi:MAG: hypothetical protein F6J86_18920 [Symploca sp. SIO1B1]|nr:hypothetical protein [Symploca sp. SIO1C2]NER95883.1 hypothetical protein [Symploca sp. SIO1B1]
MNINVSLRYCNRAIASTLSSKNPQKSAMGRRQEAVPMKKFTIMHENPLSVSPRPRVYFQVSLTNFL